MMVNKTMKRLGEERSVIRELFEYGNKRAKEIGRENVFDFSLGNPNAPAPACVQEEIERLLKTVPTEQLHGYSSAPGLYDVRKSIAEDFKSRLGAEMTPELIYMTCGAASSLMAVLTGLCEQGDEFVVIAPYFPEYRVFVESAGGTLVEALTDETFHLDLAALDRAIGSKTKAILVNSPNNPSGAVYGKEELLKLSALLRKKSEEKGEPIFLIADEPYRELSYGKEVPCLLNLYDNTIVCYSLSKSLSLAGERIGYVAVSPKAQNAGELFAAVCGAGRSLGYVCAPVLFQRVMAATLGKTSDFSVYEKNRTLLCGGLRSFGYECVEPEGAFYLFVKSPLKDATAFAEAAKKHELLLVPSDSFGVKGYVRISYCVATEVIEKSLPAFQALAKELGLK